MPKKVMHSSSLSPEELMLKSVRARRRFKALVRKVVANLYWLQEDEGDDEDYTSKNVKKYMRTLTRKKPEKGLLSLQEKSILCKPAEDRSEEEKLFLYRIIGGLKCFRKYPEHVKMQLAAVTYFVFFPPGRVIVRQNQEAHALFFIISGEVSVSITNIDPVFKEEITVNVGTMIAGSMFGEVSLLHDIPRTATITTLTPCELLCLKKADFDIVLKASVSQEWAEIQKSMTRFEYFKGWDEISVRECCLYTKIKAYSRDQVILGDGFGIPSSCYFILKGQCRIIEHLLVEVSYDMHGRKRLKLYESTQTPTQTLDGGENVILDENKNSADSLECPPTTSEFADRIDNEVDYVSLKSVRISKLSGGKSNRDSENKSYPNTAQNKDIVPFMKTNSLISKNSSLPPNVQTHFMQVCILSETACFAIGENFNRRRIIAMSDNVECLVIPRYWLMQRNKGNIWTRIKQYLDQNIPTTEQVYHEFLAQRKWNNYKKKLFCDLYKKPPQNAYYNVPYSIRINEDIRSE